MWIKLYTPPRQCRTASQTTKQQYYQDRSYKRYLLTKDGKHIANMGNNLIGEIGNIISIRHAE